MDFVVQPIRQQLYVDIGADGVPMYSSWVEVVCKIYGDSKAVGRKFIRSPSPDDNPREKLHVWCVELKSLCGKIKLCMQIVFKLAQSSMRNLIMNCTTSCECSMGVLSLR